MSRYQRLLELSSFSEKKLNILKNTNVLIIGVGGVGQHISQYLLTNGVENLTIVDFDKVELSNLNRQILLVEDDVAKDKSLIVKEALTKRNKDANVKALNLKVDESNVLDLVKGFDVVIDATDNWLSKLTIAKGCDNTHQTYLHVGVDGENGQFAIFKNKSLLDVVDESVQESKKDGVLGPMVGVISSLATIHLIRYLIGETSEVDTLFSYSYKSNQITKIKI